MMEILMANPHHIIPAERFMEKIWGSDTEVENSLAVQHGVSTTAIAAAWVLRHPAQMQLIAGSVKEFRLLEIAQASDIYLTREEWYRLYLAAGHPLP